ncbi:MAG: hypothetical protein EoVTN8_1225 [Fluviibacter phosphoraccumulans EoVTN8]
MVLLQFGEVVTATTAIATFDTDHAAATAGGDPAFVRGHPATGFAFDGDVFVGAAQIRGEAMVFWYSVVP